MSSDPFEQLRALAHPLRLQILSLLTGTAMSAAEVARETGTTQANASYHLRRLHEAGQVDLVEEVVVRGGRARRYRHDPDQVLDARPGRPGGRRAEEAHVVVQTYAEELLRRAGMRADASPSTATDAELWVDPVVWDAAVRHAQQVSRLLHRAARPPRTPGTVRTSTTMALFIMDPAARPRPVESSDDDRSQP